MHQPLRAPWPRASVPLSLMCLTLAARLLVSPAAAGPQAVSNLALNGAFKTWGPPSSDASKTTPKLLSGAVPADWLAAQEGADGGGAIAKDAAVKHDGATSLRVENTKPTDITQVDQQIAVEPETKYVVRCWIKCQIGPKGGPVVWANTGPKTDFWEHQTADPQYPKVTSDDWQPFQFSLTTGADARLMDLVLQLRSATGKVWFDDVQVVKSGTNPHVESY